jgi:hypothetical protein
MDIWFITFIIGVVIVVFLAALIISYLVRRNRRNKASASPEQHTLAQEQNSTDFLPKSEKPAEVYAAERTRALGSEEKVTPLSTVKSPDLLINQIEKSFLNKNPVVHHKPDALREIEQNFSIANMPMTGRLTNFQTNVWNTHRSEFNVLDRELLSELTESYIDMLLANNVVWLAMELKRESPDLNASYIKLSNKVAERLQKIMPAIRESFR